MPAEWREVFLEDVAAEITVGYVGPMASEYVEDGIPFLRSQNVEPLRINDNDLKFITPEFHQKIRKSRLTPGDVVIVRTGKPGSCSVIPDSLTEANCSDIVIVRCGAEIDNRFLAYYINTVATAHVNAHLVGAVQQHFNVGSARKMRINLPPLPEQKAIARILGTLDDKIELNRRLNATLEAMARALFQSWFVDFDPVHAKAAGRPPSGMDAPTTSLFPAAFQESALGEIPEGWRVGVFDELIDFVIGGDWGANDATPEVNVPCHCIRGADIPSLQEGGLGKMPIRYLKPSSVAKRGLQPGDLAIEISGGSPTQCTGRPVLISDGILESLGTPLVASNFCRIVKLKSPAFSKFAYLWIRSLYDAGLLFQFETGTTGIKNFGFVRFAEAHPLIIPESKTLAAFDTTVAPLFARIQANAAQSRTLATLRDTLLPLLLSGELSVTH